MYQERRELAIDEERGESSKQICDILTYRSFLTAKKKKQTRQVIVWEKWVVGVKYSGSKELYVT